MGTPIFKGKGKYLLNSLKCEKIKRCSECNKLLAKNNKSLLCSACGNRKNSKDRYHEIKKDNGK